MAEPPAPARPSALTFSGTGLEGGGFQNVIAVDPAASGLVLSGGDVSGFSRSTDWGTTWEPVNLGLAGLNSLRVATIAFSGSVPGRVYAGVGSKGIGGGLLVSDDGGSSWTILSAEPQFSGANNPGVPGLPAKHPRSTGKLLAFDEPGGYLYAGTFDQGVLRSSDDGQTWTTLGLAGLHVRSLIMDPTDPTVLYAATYGQRVYRITSARGDAVATRLAASPVRGEELAIVGGSLYAAAGADGIFVSPDGGETWHELAGIPQGPVWTSIEGYLACGQDVLYVGADKASSNSIMRSTDGGLAWSSLTADAAAIHLEVGGPGGEPWWLSSRHPDLMLGGAGYTVAQLALDPGPVPEGQCLKPRVMVAGRSGVWSSTDTGTNWYPLVDDLGVTINRGIAVDPNLPGRVHTATSDWVTVHSTDHLSHVAQARPAGASTGFDVAVDSSVTPSRVYVASGTPTGNSGGEIYSNSDPASGSGWVDEGLSSKVAGKRPLGIAVRKVGQTRVLLAAVDAGGVWRKAGSTWTKVNAVAMAKPQPSKGASFAWPAGSSTVYLYDRQTGVWRSSNNGQAWVKIWNRPSPYDMTGYLAVDPLAPGRLFVSVGVEGIYRLEGATTGTVEGGQIVPEEIGPFAAPGPIVAASGWVYALDQVTPDGPPALYLSDDAGGSWLEIPDATYRAVGHFPLDLAVDAAGTVYVALNGNGILVGTAGP